MILRMDKSFCRAFFLPMSAAILLVAAGCASGPPKSGFLKDYSGFSEAPDDAPIWDYVDPDGQKDQIHARIWRDKENWRAMANYDRVMIDPVVLHIQKDSQASYLVDRGLACRFGRDLYPLCSTGPGVSVEAGRADPRGSGRGDSGARRSGGRPGRTIHAGLDGVEIGRGAVDIPLVDLRDRGDGPSDCTLRLV